MQLDPRRGARPRSPEALRLPSRTPHAAGGRCAIAALLASGLLALATLAACGGVETGGTGAAVITSGSITGYASILVNGVDFDESSAKVVDDTGNTVDSGVLKLGATVRIVSGAVSVDKLTAKASQIEVVTDLLGAVDVNDPVSHSLSVLGQRVQLTPTTLYDGAYPAGPASIALGTIVQIYAIFDPSAGVYVARYVGPVAGTPAVFKLRGGISFRGLPPDGSFRVGPQVFALPAGQQPADFGLEEGGLYRLRLLPLRDPMGRWVLAGAAIDRPRPSDGDAVRLDDVINDYRSLADFGMAGLRFDASAAAVTPAGSAVGRGDRVSVQGVYSAGTVFVSQLTVKGSAADDFGDGVPGEFSIGGAVDSLDTALKTLVIRGQTISYAGAVAYSGGTEADLQVHVPLAVVGVRSGDNSSVIQANSIQFVTPP